MINGNRVTNSFLLIFLVLSLIVLTQHVSLYSKLYFPTEVLPGILIGGSPSNALLLDPKQAFPEELGRLAFSALHLMTFLTRITLHKFELNPISIIGLNFENFVSKSISI